MHAITATMNPFSAMVDNENLFNISTGKAASEETTDFLINAEHIGSSASKEVQIIFEFPWCQRCLCSKTAVIILADTQNQSSNERSKYFLQNAASIKSHLKTSLCPFQRQGICLGVFCFIH